MVSSIAIYCLYTVKGFLELQPNTDDYIQNYCYVCTELNGFKHFYLILIFQSNIIPLFAQS